MDGILAEIGTNWVRSREEATLRLKEAASGWTLHKPELAWQTAEETDLLAHLVFCMITYQTRMRPILLEAHPEVHRLSGFKGMAPPEIATELRLMKVRFPNEKSRRVSAVLSRGVRVKELLVSLSPLADGSLAGERRARDAFKGAVGGGLGLKIISLFLKDVGFASWLGVIDSQNFRFAQAVGLVGPTRSPNVLIQRSVYLRFEDWEEDVARSLGVRTADIDAPIMDLAEEIRGRL